LGADPATSRADRFREILASSDDPRHPICAGREGGTFYAEAGLFTFASTLMVLAETPELHVTLGPPDRTPWQVLRFDEVCRPA
jgi:hypothetical protein